MLFAATACADDLIDIPTARKIPFEDVRFEYRAVPVAGGDFQHFLGIGIGKSFELDLRDVQNPGYRQAGTFDFSYNFTPALPGISPGISFGVQDAANLTSDGRRFYLVTTFRNDLDAFSSNLYADVTLGVQAGSLTSPFVGVAVPFGPRFYVLAEDSGFRVSSGLEFRPSPRVTLRALVRGQQTMLSLSATSKF